MPAQKKVRSSTKILAAPRQEAPLANPTSRRVYPQICLKTVHSKTKGFLPNLGLYVGVLTAVAWPQYQKAVMKSRVTNVVLFISNTQKQPRTNGAV